MAARDRLDARLIFIVGRHPPPAGSRRWSIAILVVEVERREQDHFIAGIGHRQHGVHERHVRARCDGDGADPDPQRSFRLPRL